jgi:hypothetical protein
MKTTAEKIAELFGDDGQCWETESGETFFDACERHLPDVSRPEPGVIRHTFDDGSVLTAAGAAWDFGYSDCYCWQGAGHTETCEAKS